MNCRGPKHTPFKGVNTGLSFEMNSVKFNLNILNSGIFALSIFSIRVRLWTNVVLHSTTEAMLYSEASSGHKMFHNLLF